MVMRRARAILGSEAEAEEATQDVFIKAMQSLDHFEGRSRISSWLYKITTNMCINRLRTRNRRKELREQYLSEPEQISHHGNVVVARELLAKAPEKRWAEAAIYVYIDGMSHQEASELLGVSKRTVGNLLLRFQEWAQKKERLADEATRMSRRNGGMR